MLTSSPGGSRAVALRVIRRVTEQGAYSNLTLSAELERSELPGRDRQLAADLAYGTLRRLLVLDGPIAAASSRPLPDLDPEVLAILRMGAYQVLFTRIPAHAAVSETVELAGPRIRGFVNAILRRLAAAPYMPPAGEGPAAISSRTGLVLWAVEELARLLPPEEVEVAATSLASPADLSLRTNTCLVSRDRLLEALAGAGVVARPGAHHPDVILVRSAAPALLPGYREGWFAVQDEGSVLVAAAVGAEGGERILDACAAPGGKAGHLACSVAPDGVVVAGDVRQARAGLVRAAARRLRVHPLVLVQDGARPALRPIFDAALVDAPCSGLGSARRRPELLWRASRESLAGLARLQVAILAGTADLVQPGGRLVYAVCTFPRAETDAAVRAFLSKRPDFRPMPITGPDGEAASHRLWPHRHGTDAMFVAGFRRLPA